MAVTQYIHNHIENSNVFSHLKKDKQRTYYFELPEYHLIETELVRAITDDGYEPYVSIVTGIARCHPNDQYNKKKGREVALSKKVSFNYNFRQIKTYPSSNEVIIKLKTEFGLNITLVLRKAFTNIRILSVYEEPQ